MVRNKPRLQLALYARPKHPSTYHYALLITRKTNKNPKTTPNSATKFHVKNTIQMIDGQVVQPWRFERNFITDLSQEHRLLACVIVGKILSDVVEQVLTEVPVHQIHDSDAAETQAFTCQTWVRTALDELRDSGAVSGLLDWEVIQKAALEYVEKKKESRWAIGMETHNKRIPTMDLLVGRESLQ